jgi:hypothetical protein
MRNVSEAIEGFCFSLFFLFLLAFISKCHALMFVSGIMNVSLNIALQHGATIHIFFISFAFSLFDGQRNCE